MKLLEPLALGPVTLPNRVVSTSHQTGLVHDHHNVTTRSRGEREALLIPAVFVVSVPVALLSPLAAQLMWLALVLGRLGRAWFGRR